MPTLFGRHMIGNTVFMALDEMAEGLPDLFEYIGGECPPPPEPTGRRRAGRGQPRSVRADEVVLGGHGLRHGADQKAEYDRIESTLDFASKELLKRGCMKLLGTMLATTIGWPDYCHAEWELDDDVVKALRGGDARDGRPRPCSARRS